MPKARIISDAIKGKPTPLSDTVAQKRLPLHELTRLHCTYASIAIAHSEPISARNPPIIAFS